MQKQLLFGSIMARPCQKHLLVEPRFAPVLFIELLERHLLLGKHSLQPPRLHGKLRCTEFRSLFGARCSIYLFIAWNCSA